MSDTPKRLWPGMTVRFEADVKAAIEKAAKADRRSASSLIEIAVISYLKEKGFLADDR